MDPVFVKLSDPLSVENPCGENLADSPVLMAFDAYHVFGNLVPPAKDKTPNWRALRDEALAVLDRTRDLRPLAHLAAATLHVDGLVPFTEVVQVAGRWFANFPTNLFPPVEDGDAIARKSALDCLADHVAVIEGIRTRPFLSKPGLGSFSLRDLDLVQGKTSVDDSTAAEATAATEALLATLLHSDEIEHLSNLCDSLANALDALRQIEKAMQDAHGVQAIPDFKPLHKALSRIQVILQGEIEARSAATGAESGLVEGTAPPEGGAAVTAVGGIRSRDDAIRALDAVAGYFRRNEPSSPIPMFIERAKRLVSKDFLQVLADIAPEGLAQARNVGGVREE